MLMLYSFSNNKFKNFNFWNKKTIFLFKKLNKKRNILQSITDYKYI